MLRAFGANRIAWGSNFPTNAGTLAGLLRASLEALSFASSDELDAVFCDTAEKLYPALTRCATRA